MRFGDGPALDLYQLQKENRHIVKEIIPGKSLSGRDTQTSPLKHTDEKDPHWKHHGGIPGHEG